MSIFDTLKRWVGLAPKEPVEQQAQPPEKTVTLPNGRRAVVDEVGNFVRFDKGDPNEARSA